MRMFVVSMAMLALSGVAQVTVTIVQRDDGSIPTWWNPKGSHDSDWINCMAVTAEVLGGPWPVAGSRAVFALPDRAGSH